MGSKFITERQTNSVTPYMGVCGFFLSVKFATYLAGGKHKRRGQFHKHFASEFHIALLMMLVKIRAFNIEPLPMLIDHRIPWKGKTVKMAGG